MKPESIGAMSGWRTPDRKTEEDVLFCWEKAGQRERRNQEKHKLGIFEMET